MFFGRIITGGKKVKVPWFILTEDTYSPSEVPTAILGKKFAEDTFGKENVFLLDRNILPNVIWVYGKTENRSKHDNELSAFFEKCFNDKAKSIDYQFINIFTCGYTYIKKILKYIDSDRKKSVYVTDKHVYIYSGKQSVAGISLSDCRYIGVGSKRIIERIKENPSNIVFDDLSFINGDERKYLKDNKIIVPVIHFSNYSAFSE